jgi:hypothetical protein
MAELASEGAPLWKLFRFGLKVSDLDRSALEHGATADRSAHEWNGMAVGNMNRPVVSV